MSSHLPSAISLKPLIVSATLTYRPSRPVNWEATKKGWEKNFCIFRARATTSLSSSESSSMPRIAMMSWRSLYFWSVDWIARAVASCSGPRTWGAIRVVGGDVHRLDRGDRTLVRRRDAPLERAHLRRERRLVTDGARDTAEERGHFR